MKILNLFLFTCFCVFAFAGGDPMQNESAHAEAVKKVESYDLEKLRTLSDEKIITWALCPGYELGKDEIIQLVKNEELTFDGPWTSIKIRLTPEERHEDEKHIALCWANEIDGESDAREKSKNDETEMGYFKSGERLLLEKGHWNGHAFEYTYRWPGDKEKGKSIKITVDITIKDPTSEVGAFLQGVIDRAKNIHHAAKHEKSASVATPAASVKQVPPAYGPPVQPVQPIIIEEHRAPYYGYPYWGGPGIWLGGGWGRREGWHGRHWR